jgi:transcriptional regulator with PAS, ATPase and Fis domain
VAVNCGAIPEGTIDSELFGHEKGAFTGAHESRKGYFEVADGGTIFLDEVAELPLSTQVRLLRVLESGEFMKVGSSKTQKTDVRIIAATNVNVQEALRKGKFREDLFYRLNTVSIQIPALRKRKGDISLLFKKFTADFADKYNTPPIRLSDNAMEMLINYPWPGNIRQLKNFVAQISVIEKERNISSETLDNYIPHKIKDEKIPILFEGENSGELTEREILYKVLFDMKKDLTELKKITFDLMQEEVKTHKTSTKVFDDLKDGNVTLIPNKKTNDTIDVSQNLSLFQQEKILIEKALDKHKGKRKYAAKELGISERTLYRKIKEFDL